MGGGLTSSYLTSSIPGEDRRAPQNTIDETVWQTLSRDLLAVWEKMRQVLYPKYLLGGILGHGGGGIGAGDWGQYRHLFASEHGVVEGATVSTGGPDCNVRSEAEGALIL